MDIISESYDGQGVSEQKKLFKIPESKKGKAFLVAAGILALGTLTVFTASYSSFVGTRAIGVGGPRVSVRQGETISLNFPLKQASMGRVVEICNKNLLKTTCKSLSLKIGKGSSVVDVVIPINYKQGKADLRLVGIYRNGAKVLVGTKAILVLPFVAGNNGGGSGGSGGSNGGGNIGGPGSTPLPYSVSTPTPTPPLPYGPY
jgi:hypothetical protein